MTPVYEIDPLTDPRWVRLLERHPSASVFHTPGWLEALRRSYGYEPFALTTCPPTAELTNGVAFCRIKSWLSGCRTVSLPFSDHCEPLVADGSESWLQLLQHLRRDAEQKRLKYIEIRPLSCGLTGLNGRMNFQTARVFCWHKLDLRPTLDELFRNSHKSCVQRKIRRAEREGLTSDEGRSGSLVAKFYDLFLLTRRGQQLPPPPLDWFRNLADCLGEKIKIRVASKGDRPVAGILTLSHGDVLVYKYACSDPRFKNLGATHFLLWKAIQEAKSTGLLVLDLGRSAYDNPGLIRFKDRWGATRSMLTYSRYPAHFIRTLGEGWEIQIGKKIFSHMPDCLLTLAGRLLYRHIG